MGCGHVKSDVTNWDTCLFTVFLNSCNKEILLQLYKDRKYEKNMERQKGKQPNNQSLANLLNVISKKAMKTVVMLLFSKGLMVELQ